MAGGWTNNRLTGALLVCAGLVLIAVWLAPQLSMDVIDQTESPYQSIYISESGGVRSMHVGSLRDRTSAMDLEEPYRHIYEYTAMMMVALGYVQAPERFLVVGLGGGTITRSLRRLYPDAEIVNVEFDPEIVRMARTHFDFAEDEHMEVVVQDARRWLRSTTQQFDVIFLDAYHGGYIPFHLTTREFLEIVRERLALGGVVCSNTWMGQDLAHRESATYDAVFGGFHQYLGRRSTNRIIVAAPRMLPAAGDVRARLAALESQLDPEPLNLTALFERHFDPDPTWPENAKILTDDHAPVNLLKDRG